MTMNTEHLLQLADVLEAAGDRFNLCWFAAELDNNNVKWIKNLDWDYPAGEALCLDDEPKCNTVGCVAGWANAIGNPHTAVAADTTAAARWLGIEHQLAYDRLFMANKGSIWADLAGEYDWTVDEHTYEIDGWDQITGAQAADVLRRLARGELTL